MQANRFAYRVYYEYRGEPSHAKPFPGPKKDANEIACALSRVPFEISALLSDHDAKVTPVPGSGFQHSITFVVETTQQEGSVTNTVNRYVSGEHHLFGGQLDPGTLTCLRCAALRQATDQENAGRHLQLDEAANYTGGVKTVTRPGEPPLETVFKVYRRQHDACRTRWLRYSNKADGRFVGWHLAAQDNA
jgi:hypothetical protein